MLSLTIWILVLLYFPNQVSSLCSPGQLGDIITDCFGLNNETEYLLLHHLLQSKL
jgi:hypothetical protein